MTADDWVKIIGAVVGGLISILGLLLPYLYQKLKHKAEDAQLSASGAQMKADHAEVRSNTAIDFLLRRARAETLMKGLVDADDNLIVDLNPYYESFYPALKQLHPRVATLTDSQLFEELERVLGSRFVDKVCPALKVQDGACVYLAILWLRKYDPEAAGEPTKEHPAIH